MIGPQVVETNTPPGAVRAAGLRILFLTPRFPYPPIKGDTLRVYHQLRALSKEHRITLLSIADAPVAPHDLAEVAAFCERVEIVPLPTWRAMIGAAAGLFGRAPLQVAYYQLPAVRHRLAALLHQPFDALHVTLIRMLPYVWDLRQPPIVVDLIDSLGLNLAARRAGLRGPKRLLYELEYRRVRAYEHAAVRHFPRLVVSSPADRDDLGGGDVTVIPNGVDLERFAYRDTLDRAAQTLIFTGNMGYEPNEAAVVWFAAEVWPQLRAQRPDLRWQIAGARPTERVRALHNPAHGVEVLGQVNDLIGHLANATIAVAPMRNGSGIQNKVLEALAVGTPMVATPLGNRGVGATGERDLLLADSAADYAAAVLRLLDEPETRERLSRAGRRFVEDNFRWDEHARRLAEIYAAVRQK